MGRDGRWFICQEVYYSFCKKVLEFVECGEMLNSKLEERNENV